jgi:capsular polysaccharide biosynthesis protein
MTTYPAKYKHLAVYIHAEAEPEPSHAQPWRLVGCLAVALSAGLVLGLVLIVVAKLLEVL